MTPDSSSFTPPAGQRKELLCVSALDKNTQTCVDFMQKDINLFHHY